MSETLAAKILDYVCENMGIEPEWSVRGPSELAWWSGDLR